VAALLEGSATAEGTARYAARFAHLPGHFGALDGLALASVGLGTYLGREDDATDRLYEHAVERAVERGINVVDSAINYRHQRSERAIGAALRAAISRGALARDEVFVATKGGYIPFDAAIPADPRAWFAETYLRPGIVFPDDVVGGAHCMTPRYLLDQLERSRANLGLATLDLYYVHNPEGQLDEVDRDAFMARIRDAFDALEGAVRDGRIRRYGTATWNGYRVDASEPGHLSLADLVRVAREVGGEDHHFGAIQLPYNLAMPEAFARATQRIGDAFVPTLEAARQLDVYVMASASVYQGRLARDLSPVVAEYLPGLTTDAQRALQFVRSTPGIGTALVGMKTIEHVEENAGVAAVAPLPWERFRRLFEGA